jgi:hypothetical protein
VPIVPPLSITGSGRAYTGTVRDLLLRPDYPVDRRKYLRAARDAVAEIVADLLTVLHDLPSIAAEEP